MGRDSGGTKPCEAVVHNKLAVVFSAMFDDAVCNVDNARFLLRVINNLRHQAFVAFRPDGGCAIGEGLLDERNDVLVVPRPRRTSLCSSRSPSPMAQPSSRKAKKADVGGCLFPSAESARYRHCIRHNEHSGEHYRQLVVYYRLAGLVPPESRPKK